MTKPFIVEFQPACVHTVTTGETSLMELARSLGIAVESSCGGRGTCRSCAVRIEGAVPKATPDEASVFTDGELDAGWRRACQTRPVGPCTIHLPARGIGQSYSTGKEAGEETVPIGEPIWTPAAETGTWYGGSICSKTYVGDTPIGLSVDLGTTNIAASLVNLHTGDITASESMTNPQVAFGADVISRLEYALKGKKQAQEIQQAAVNAVDEIADRLTNGKSKQIVEVAVVGNTVMQHLFLGLPVESLSRAPYTPAILTAKEITASDIGLAFAPEASLYCAPNVAGFVGGDHVSALLDLLDKVQMRRWCLIDIGTNTEIALIVDGRITSVSCASGPAFEGGKLACGMRAAPGAIDRARIGDTVEISTIADRPAVGICGSGVLSLMAALKNAGIIDSRGRMQLGHPSVRQRGPSREFVLRDNESSSTLPIVFTQSDVRAVQLAKAAIRTGLDILLREEGIDASDLDCIVIAGAFGKFVQVEDAVLIGMIPEISADRIVQVGNSAGAGVQKIVACRSARRKANDLATRIRYLELASASCFQEMFLARCRL